MNAFSRPSPARVSDEDSSQVKKLYRVIDAACDAAPAARNLVLFASHEGLRLMEAIFQLTECDAVKTICDDIRHELRIDDEGFPLDSQGDRKIEPLPRVTTQPVKLNPEMWGDL